MIELHHGDCLEVLRTLPAASVDACVTDPPYGLGFMGKAWDSPSGFVPRADGSNKRWDHVGGNHNPSNSADASRTRAVEGRKFQVWCEAWALEVLRVLKPGGHLLAFGGTRTYHRLACAVEDAGFEIRDQVGWAFGSGFPKSLNVGNGWGTALKPAWEPIVMARKPLQGTVAANVLAHGTGALNIDACRVETSGPRPDIQRRKDEALDDTRNAYGRGINGSRYAGDTVAGRWPANLIHDGSEEVVALFPAEAGAFAPVLGTEPSGLIVNAYGPRDRVTTNPFHGDSGSAARFFYCSKASSEDRDEGLEAFERSVLRLPDGGGTNPMTGRPVVDVPRANHHPTVKPVDLMRYLCRLVTPPGGVVLDPFMGSGSTGKAAKLEDFGFIGIERELEYVELARARVGYVQTQIKLFA